MQLDLQIWDPKFNQIKMASNQADVAFLQDQGQ